MAFNEDGLHVDSDFTKKCVMFSNSSVTTHSGYHSDTEGLLQEALLACNLQDLSSESSQKSGCPLIRRVSVISLSFLLSSCSLSEARRVDLQYSFQLQESTILSDWYASVDHEAGEQGVTFVMFCMVIHSQTMTLTVTDWHDWNESYLFLFL